jgi:hypothetical protein
VIEFAEAAVLPDDSAPRGKLDLGGPCSRRLDHMLHRYRTLLQGAIASSQKCTPPGSKSSVPAAPCRDLGPQFPVSFCLQDGRQGSNARSHTGRYLAVDCAVALRRLYRVLMSACRNLVRLKTRRPTAEPPAREDPFDIAVHAVAGVHLEVVGLAEMDGLEVIRRAADQPVATALLTLNQDIERAMHGDEQHVVARKEIAQGLRPSVGVQNIFQDQIIASIGIGRERCLKAVEKGAPGVRPDEVAVSKALQRKDARAAKVIYPQLEAP